ncbi:hypothetical protein T05_8712 [Trichinella murrelli]|uniref:Uncharacterized protein n=1 Tax=Trichinella murrelli TaxID=144512 RepID=A0A0V0TAR4_9BILA|nr:hypothetical protein T05_8712 [Trichinella murrelli]
MGQQLVILVVPSTLGINIRRLAFVDRGRSPADSQILNRLARSAAFNFWRASDPAALGQLAFSSRATSSAVIG